MVLDTKKPQGAHNAARYKESLRDGREVWLDGEKVKDVTTHPAFASTIDEMARIYELQHTDEYRDQMTFVSPDSGVRCSLSYLLPYNIEDLKKKRRNSEIWNQQAWGQFGRGPDLLPQFVLGLYNNKEALSTVKNPHCDFGENVVNYHTYCQENDIFLTHALGDPQVDRSQQPQNETRQIKEEELALHVVEETNEGIIVSGAKQLSSAAHMSNDTYVSLSATFVRRADPRFIQAFSIPSNSKGLKIICREPVSQYPGTFGHPFGVKYDEQDSMLFFDNVMVPWERVFMLYDASAMVQRLAGGANFMGYSNYIRIHERMKTMTAVASMIAEAIGVSEFREVAAKLGEMIMFTEIWRHAINGLEQSAYMTQGGLMSLGRGTGMNIFFAQFSQRMVELLRQIGGSGIVMQPSEKDLANAELRPFLDKYMRGKDVTVEYKSRLYRLAHDLSASSFAMRQEIYEYWHGGDPNRNRVNLYRGHDQSEIMDRIKDMIAKPLPYTG